VTTLDGRRLPGEFFPHLMKDFPVRRFQVVQETEAELLLRIVPGSAWDARIAERIDTLVADALGPATSLRLDIVDDIPLTAAGKLQVVVNRCTPRVERKGGRGAGPTVHE
jgi:phenylacetate-CoA ligase